MREADEFRLTVRRGCRAATPTVVAHMVTGTGEPTSVGFVVSKGVGTAVRRNEVKRRLRHLMADRLQQVEGARVVIRALPAAAGADSARLGADLDRAIARCGKPR